MSHSSPRQLSGHEIRSGIYASDDKSCDSLLLFLLLPMVAMSLGWGLRGTIGGGFLGAMIPGAIVTLCLCQLLGWRNSVGIIAAIGTVGVGIGGQETYGQTIGLLRNVETLSWGMLGLTIKGGMWGLSGGVLIGLAFTHSKYRWWQIAIGLALMLGATYLGWMLIDEPHRFYFSKQVVVEGDKDPPRGEIWFGLTLGGLVMTLYLLMLRKETISTVFALGGMLAGAVGFGGGGLFLAYGSYQPEPYQGYPWWKMMEFTFGALYGLGLGLIAWFQRHALRAVDAEMSQKPPFDLLRRCPVVLIIVLAIPLAIGWDSVGKVLVAVTAPNPAGQQDQQPEEGGGAVRNPKNPNAGGRRGGDLGIRRYLPPAFGLRVRATMSFYAAELILIALLSNRLAWHVALSMTVSAFLQDFLTGGAQRNWFGDTYRTDWRYLVAMTTLVVIVVALAEWRGCLAAAGAILGLSWFATPFGFVKVALAKADIKPDGTEFGTITFSKLETFPQLFVPSTFVIELLITTVLVAMVHHRWKRTVQVGVR